MHARLVLARAVTVAIRYLSIRRQFKDRDATGHNEPETAVLDYSTVQIRVIPLLAATFALHYSGKAMGDLYG
jgi:acyl-CoA oxidase